MPELSRTQVAVFGAITVALLFVGARAVRGESGGGGATDYTSSYGNYESGSSDYSSGEDEAGEGGEEAGEGTFAVSGSGSDAVVDVTGAVERPGVYRLPAGSRVDDAVKRAGGATAKAELDSLNLAARLADGQQVVVPEQVPLGAGGASGAAVGAGAGAEEDGPISLGTASAAELDTIDGIGPVTAEDIIEFREGHGGLSSVDQLDQISGIGPATMEALRERLQP
jgi:competence protein ComEA